MSLRFENQVSINNWQRQTFPEATAEGCIKHLREEFTEFLQHPSEEEAADIIICLYHWAATCLKPFFLQDAVEHKMAKNRVRSWNIQPDGTGRHTSAEGCADDCCHPDHGHKEII